MTRTNTRTHLRGGRRISDAEKIRRFTNREKLESIEDLSDLKTQLTGWTKEDETQWDEKFK